MSHDARRYFALPSPFPMKRGGVLHSAHVAYETWGELNATRDNAVLVLTGLSPSAHMMSCKEDPTPGWWEDMAGPGKAIDTERFYVVAANILGGCQGTTGPSSPGPDGAPWGGSFPALTVRDQVRAEVAFADQLGVQRWRGVIGGSAGGMRALEWAIGHPDRVERLFLLATSAAASAEQIALSATQIDAIRGDIAYVGGDYYDGPTGPLHGLDLARRIAHISYRSEAELATRFGRDVQGDGRFAVESYLQHHGAKLVNRFDANSYVTLSAAMNSHDVGRERGGVAAALARITADTTVAGIDSDRLYPLHQQQELVDGIPDAGSLEVVKSPYGHDGFLIESEQVGELARRLLG